MLKLGRFGQQIRNTWKVLKCGAGEGWRRMANWIGHILLWNCLLKQVIEGKVKGEIEVIRRRGRRRKKLLDNLKHRRGYSHLKEEALDRTMWKNRFGGGAGPVREITEWMKKKKYIYIYTYISVCVCVCLNKIVCKNVGLLCYDL